MLRLWKEKEALKGMESQRRDRDEISPECAKRAVKA